MYPYVCKLEYYDDEKIPYQLRKMNLLLYAESFEDAMRVVSHYIDNIESVHLYCVGDEYTIFEVEDNVADEIIKSYIGENTDEH